MPIEKSRMDFLRRVILSFGRGLKMTEIRAHDEFVDFIAAGPFRALPPRQIHQGIQ
jgi:hypothetical protein